MSKFIAWCRKYDIGSLVSDGKFAGASTYLVTLIFWQVGSDITDLADVAAVVFD